MSVYFAKSLAEEDVVFTEALEPDLCEFAGGDVGSNTVCFGTLGVGLGGGDCLLCGLLKRECPYMLLEICDLRPRLPQGMKVQWCSLRVMRMNDSLSRPQVFRAQGYHQSC